jgi:hypothetical protein
MIYFFPTYLYMKEKEILIVCSDYTPNRDFYLFDKYIFEKINLLLSPQKINLTIIDPQLTPSVTNDDIKVQINFKFNNIVNNVFRYEIIFLDFVFSIRNTKKFDAIFFTGCAPLSYIFGENYNVQLLKYFLDDNGYICFLHKKIQKILHRETPFVNINEITEMYRERNAEIFASDFPVSQIFMILFENIDIGIYKKRIISQNGSSHISICKQKYIKYKYKLLKN